MPCLDGCARGECFKPPSCSRVM